MNDTSGPVENAVWYLRRHRLFENVTDSAITGCAHLFVQRTYPAKTVLFDQGDPARVVYLVKSGQVRISRVSEDGKDITLAILGKGDIFGEELLFSPDVARTTQAKCLEDSYLCLSRMQDLFAVLSRHPIVAMNIAKYMMEQREEALSIIEDLYALKVPDRLVRLFERLASDHGVPATGGTRVDIRLTHAQIASLIGSTRETVTLEISRLLRAGKLRTDGGYYVIPCSPVPAVVTS